MKGLFMGDVSMTIAVGAVVVGAVGIFLFSLYSGVHGSLSTARVGEVYNFQYEQPYHGDPDRFLAKVLDVHTLDENDIRRLNARSKYRRNDPVFQRTKHLVTCQTADGKVRHFYAERAKNVRRTFLGGLFIKSKAAGLFF
jgi:hypothetical protein